MHSQRLTMFSFVVILLIGFAGIEEIYAKPPLQVVKGHEVSIEEFPFIVQVRIVDGFLCGGTLISNRHVLSAAHCVAIPASKTVAFDSIRHPKGLMVYSGSNLRSSRQNAHEVEKVHVYPLYTGKKDDYRHDISILTLKYPIVPNNKQKPGYLPSRDVDIGEFGEVIGWGSEIENGQLSEKLKRVSVYLTNSTECQKFVGAYLYDTQVCGLSNDGSGFCTGDSGGPLIVDHELAGIVSYVFRCGNRTPNVYTNVYKYRSWISGIVDAEL